MTLRPEGFTTGALRTRPFPEIDRFFPFLLYRTVVELFKDQIAVIRYLFPHAPRTTGLPGLLVFPLPSAFPVFPAQGGPRQAP